MCELVYIGECMFVRVYVCVGEIMRYECKHICIGVPWRVFIRCVLKN